jgi:hypothetical protein
MERWEHIIVEARAPASGKAYALALFFDAAGRLVPATPTPVDEAFCGAWGEPDATGIVAVHQLRPLGVPWREVTREQVVEAAAGIIATLA